MVTRWGTWDTVVRWSRLGWCESGQFHVFSHATVTMGWLPPELDALTNHAEADFETLGGCLLPINHTPFYPQPPERWVTAAPPVAVPTLLESSADTGDSDLDADGETEVEELEDEQDRDANNDSEMGEMREDQFYATLSRWESTATLVWMTCRARGRYEY
jgi:hypothetical protein